MTDIHSHIIPKIDDGSDSIESSIAMLKEAVSFGITDIIATPHYCPVRGYYNSVSDIKKGYEELVEEAKKVGLPINIYLGEEIYCSEYDDIISKLDRGELLTLNDTRYVLIEYSPSKAPKNLLENLYNLTVHGYKPIIAHLERYKWMNVQVAYDLYNEGCKLQVNASSISGLKYKHLCKRLIKEDLVDIIASDIHFGRKNCFKNINYIESDKLLIKELILK